MAFLFVPYYVGALKDGEGWISGTIANSSLLPDSDEQAPRQSLSVPHGNSQPSHGVASCECTQLAGSSQIWFSHFGKQARPVLQGSHCSPCRAKVIPRSVSRPSITGYGSWNRPRRVAGSLNCLICYRPGGREDGHPCHLAWRFMVLLEEAWPGPVRSGMALKAETINPSHYFL